jgi:hypothetical protein
LGGWLDEETGLVYLDLSVVVDGAEEAEQLARQHNQEAYYDLERGQTVVVKKPQERRQAPPGDGPAGEHQRGGLEEGRQGDLQRADGRSQGLTSHDGEGEHELSEISGQFGAAVYQNPADRTGYPEGNGPPGEDSGDLREGRSGRVLPENGVDYLVASPGGERGAQLREAARLLWMGYP